MEHSLQNQNSVCDWHVYVKCKLWSLVYFKLLTQRRHIYICMHVDQSQSYMLLVSCYTYWQLTEARKVPADQFPVSKTCTRFSFIHLYKYTIFVHPPFLRMFGNFHTLFKSYSWNWNSFNFVRVIRNYTVFRSQVLVTKWQTIYIQYQKWNWSRGILFSSQLVALSQSTNGMYIFPSWVMLYPFYL